jgi:hypothetical protein
MTFRVLFLLTGLAAAAGAQTVVSDDATLHRTLREAKPGQTIRIAPGTYAGGLYAEVQGTKDRPITLEAADPSNPPLIKGGGNGIQLARASYITVRHLRLQGATDNGINIDDGGTDTRAVGIVIEGLVVEDVGAKGNHDGIKLSGLKGFTVRDCTVVGWGGNAIDLVGCSDGVIERCTVRGKDGFEQATGPQLKGGTSNVAIRDCLFDHAGERAVNAGGSTGLQFFRPKDAGYEARDLTIENNVFIGSTAPIAFVGVDGAVFRHSTIIDPDKWVMRILQETVGERFAPCRNVVFERNLVVYGKGVRVAVNIGPNTAPDTFKFVENWWYCPDAPVGKPSLPTKESNGVYGKDPKVTKTRDGWIETKEDYGAKRPSP